MDVSQKQLPVLHSSALFLINPQPPGQLNLNLLADPKFQEFLSVISFHYGNATIEDLPIKILKQISS